MRPRILLVLRIWSGTLVLLLLFAPRLQATHPFIPPCSQIKIVEEPSVATSKQAILETGISESYFNQHFQAMESVKNDSGMIRKIVWKYSIGDYAVTLVDEIETFVNARCERRNRHSIKEVLGASYDIATTISRDRAIATLRDCLGDFVDEHVFYERKD